MTSFEWDLSSAIVHWFVDDICHVDTAIEIAVWIAILSLVYLSSSGSISCDSALQVTVWSQSKDEKHISECVRVCVCVWQAQYIPIVHTNVALVMSFVWLNDVT